MTKMTRIQQNSIRKNHFKPLWAIFIVLAILCIVPIAAEELTTFDNVKQYNEITKTTTIVNTLGLGRDIASIKLNTPIINKVGLGYVQVAEFEVDLFDDTYTDALKEIEFYDKTKEKWNRNEVEIQFDYKYKTIEEVIVDDYTCGSYNNCIVTGNHIVEKVVWKDFNEKTLVKGKVTVGVFTTTYEGQKVEWIPNYFGIKIDEWATWDASLNTGLVAYWDFESNTGTDIIDRTLKGSDGVGNNASAWTTGKIGTGWHCDGADDFVYFGDNSTDGYTNWDTYGNEFTIAFWDKDLAFSNTPYFAMSDGNADGHIKISDPASSGGAYVYINNNNTYLTRNNINQPMAGHSTNTWYFVVLTYSKSNTNVTLYGNGSVLVTETKNVDNVNGKNGALKICTELTNYRNAVIDEMGFWSRALTQTEVTTLYAGGDGMTYELADGPPTITLNTPPSGTNFTTSSITFAGVVTDDVNLINVSLIINDAYNETNTAGTNNTNYTFTKTLAEGDYTWNYEACDNASQCTNETARSFSIDATYPSLKVIYPNETITFHELNTNLQLNWSANDSNIGSCWYNWNTTNISVTCADNTTNINITDGTNKNLTFYVNDTFGQLNSSFVSWNYRLFKNSETYDNEVFEGLNSIFSINLLTNGSDITVGNLNYNNTNYLVTLSNHGSNNFTLTKTVTAPPVVSNTNKTFYWNVIQGALSYNLTAKNQTIINLEIDDCTANTIVLYNFTMKDEEDLTKLSSAITTARLNLQIYGFATTNLIQEYNKTYTNVNSFSVCLNDSLSTGGSFSNNVEVQYEATGYVTELYYIQNETITSTDFNQNISLYDLNETDSQVFKIIFRDSSFLPVENALIKIYRKYVDEGIYRIVEIPKTDKRGETTTHLVLNEVIYKLEVVKYGTVLETFTDVIAVCQTPLVASCEIDLNAFSESVVVPDFEDAEDFSFTLGYDNDTRIVSSIFSIPSGSVQTISLNVTREDSLGTAVCTDSLLSSSGTLSCVVPTSFGNSTIVAKIYKEGVIQAQGQISLDQTPYGIYGVNLVFLALFVMITLIGAGMSDNPIYTTIFLLVGVALLFALNLVANDGFIGATATILFLVVAIVLVIIKGSGRN